MQLTINQEQIKHFSKRLGSEEQARTGPSRRHIQGSKIAKGLPSVNLQYSKIEKAKNMNRVARRGPLARASGALKGGHF